MTCPTCHRDLPETKLVCAACLETNYRRELAETEIQLMPKIIRGELPLTLLLPSGGKSYHLGFRSGFSSVPYCQSHLGSPRQSWRNFKERPNNLCSKCLSTLKTFAEKSGMKI